MRVSNKAKAFAAAFAMTLLFGASFVGSKVALVDFTPVELVFLRFLVAALIFLAAARFLKPTRIERRDHLKLLLLCIFEPGIYFYLEALGLQRTEASTAAVLICTIPIYVLFLEAAWLKLRVTASEIFLVLLSIAGVILLISTSWVKGLGHGRLAGDLFILGGSLAAAIYTVMASQLLKRYNAVAITRVQSFYAVAFYFPFAVYDFTTKGFPSATTRSWIAILYLGVGCSFFAYLFLNISLTHLKASVVSTFANLVPVVAAGLAAVILHERLGKMQLAGGAVVIAAVFLLARKQRMINPPTG